MPLPSEHAAYPWTVEKLEEDPESFLRAFGAVSLGAVQPTEAFFETAPREPGSKIEVVTFGPHAHSTRKEPHRKLTVLPQRLTLKEPFVNEMTAELETYVANMPERDTLCQRLLGRPAAWLAIDFVLEMDVDPAARPEDIDIAALTEQGGARRRVAEIDDWAAYVGSGLQPFHPTAFSHFAVLQADLNTLERPMRLIEYEDNNELYGGTAYHRIHDDSHWMREWSMDELIEEVSLVARARRWERGANEFLRFTDQAVLLTGSELRDYKGTLAAPEVNLGLLMRDPAATRKAIDLLRKANLLGFVKMGYGARKEGAWAMQEHSRKQPGESGPGLIERKLNNCLEDGRPVAMPAIIQPRFKPCTMANLGFQFADNDIGLKDTRYGRYERNRVLAEFGDQTFRTFPAPGNEAAYSALFRAFYPLGNLLGDSPKNYKPSGALLRFRTNAFAIHGASDVLCAMVDLEGVERLPDPGSLARSSYGT